MLDSWRSSSPRFGHCYHIAVSGKRGQIMILKWDNLQPIARIPAKGPHEGVCDLRFTPASAPVPMLAAASHDQHIYVYNIKKGYQCAFAPCDLLGGWTVWMCTLAGHITV